MALQELLEKSGQLLVSDVTCEVVNVYVFGNVWLVGNWDEVG